MDPLTTSLTNPAGERVRVTWIPREVTGYNLRYEAAGIREWAWEIPEDPPVGWVQSFVTNKFILTPSLRMFSEDHTVVVTGQEVRSLDDLAPGCYYLERLPSQSSF